MMEKLGDGPLSVTILSEPFAMSLTAVVQHLQVLEETGLVHTEKIGRVRTCRLEAAGLDLLERWIRERRSAWERRLDRLGDLLNEANDPPS